LFGYFPAASDDPINLPGGMIFTCLSHDIIAHEMAHAILDGVHPRFMEPSNPDVHAFHEAFADIVAVFQHFSMPEALHHQIARTRGDLASQNMLGELAQQFGQATGRGRALRSAIGTSPSRDDYERHREPHDRGAVLVAAVFDAFLSIYKRRIADLLRIATGGSGVLPAGELHPDLVARLSDEASKTARHVLRICIRALDYCPPVDITFGEYLRALITADYDVVRDDTMNYRVAFVDGFRRRGIYPRDVRSLSIDSLRWESPRLNFPNLIDRLKRQGLTDDISQCKDRRSAFNSARYVQAKIHDWLFRDADLNEEVTRQFGIAIEQDAPKSISRKTDSAKPSISVQSFRPAKRVGPDGSANIDLVIELTQKRYGFLEKTDQDRYDREGCSSGDFVFRGGCTLLLDSVTGEVRYCIAKNILSDSRLERQREFEKQQGDTSLHATYFGERNGREPFALLHRGIA